MTLIASVCLGAFCVQVSERLVTAAMQKHDPIANKQVVLGARDGMVTIGFSGLAYLRDTPTDDVIAEILAETDVSVGMIGPIRQTNLDLWHRMGRLRDLLAQRFTSLHPDHRGQPLELSVVGFQRRSRLKGFRRVSWEVTNHGGGAKFELVNHVRGDRLRHLWVGSERQSFQVIGAHDPPADAELAEAVNATIRQGVERLDDSLTRLQQAFVAAIRRAADRSDLIGKDCVAVRITPYANPPKRPHVLVAYYPDIYDRGALVSSKSAPVEVPAIFTPWILTPGTYAAPSIAVGAGAVTVDGLEIRTDLPDGVRVASPPGLIHAQSRLKRRPPPR